MQPLPRWKDWMAIGAVLLVCLLVLFPGVFFRGEVLVPADQLFQDPMFAEVVPEGWQFPRNFLTADQTFQFYPYSAVAWRELQETGRFPLWNPYFYAGQPLLANSQSALLYPVTWLLYLVSPAWMLTIRTLLSLVAAGLGMYFWARLLGVKQGGALLAGVTFAISGTMVTSFGYPHGVGLSWLPWGMVGCELVLTERYKKTGVLVLAASLALSITAGHIETAAHNLMAVGLYSAGRLLMTPETWARRIRLGLPLLAGVFLALLLSAAHWLPFAGYLAENPYSRSRSMNPDSVFYTPDWTYNVITLATLWYPDFFGNPGNTNYWWPFDSFQNYLEQTLYFGALPMALAAGALFVRDEHAKRKWLLAGLALGMLALALRLPGIEGINYLPGLSVVNNTRLKWYLALFGAALAGFGLDALQNALQEPARHRRFWLAVGSVLGVGLAFALAFYSYKYYRLWFDPVEPWTFLDHWQYRIFSLRKPGTLVTVAGYGLLPVFFWGMVRWPGLRKWAAPGVLAAVMLQLLVVGRPYNASMPESLVYPLTTPIASLQKDTSLYRIAPEYYRFGFNYATVFGFFDVGGYDHPPNQAYKALYNAQGGRGYQQFWQPDFPLLDWMNVKYLFRREPLEDPRFKEVFTLDGLYVYENTTALPRTFMVYTVEVEPDPARRVERLVGGDFDFSSTALLEKPLAVPPGAQPSAPGTVAWQQYRADELILSVETPVGGVLVMSEVYSQGWNVEVNGQPAEALVVNHAFRGVYLPAGSHAVRWEYQPQSFRVGAVLSLVGLLVFSLALVIRPRSLQSSPRYP